MATSIAFHFSKAQAARITLHSIFLLVIIGCQPVFKALYMNGYHFQWNVEFQPFALTFLLLVITFSYLTAFVAMRPRKEQNKVTGTIIKILLVIALSLGFIFTRYGVDQYLHKWIWGITNYPEDVTFSYFFHDNLVYSFCILLAGLFLKFMDDWYVNDRIKSKLEQQNLRLELDFLKSQINPHFLFNTLNNIQSYIIQDEKMTSVALIGRLSEFMRFALYECDKEYIDLAKEIEMLEDYIALERVRYEDRLDIIFEVQGEFNFANIPPMLLIPFVENAFKHGADMQLGGAFIHIHITKKANHLHLNVKNNFLLPATTGPVTKNGGIGLKNVKKRLQHYFPKRHILQLQQNRNIFEADLQLELNEPYT